MVRKNNEDLRSKHELILDEIKYINKNDSVNLFTRQIYSAKGQTFDGFQQNIRRCVI